MRRLITIYLMVSVATLIFFQAMAAGEEVQLTSNSYNDSSPKIHNGQVV